MHFELRRARFTPAPAAFALLLAALLCCGLAPAPAAAQEALPFLATYTGVASVSGPDANGFLSVSSTLSDPLASLGLSEALFSQTVLVFANPNVVDGTSVFRPAGGAGLDSLFTSYSGTATPIDPAAGDFVTEMSGTFTVTGGTGRFEGATGSGEWSGEADLTDNSVNVTFQGEVNAAAIPEPGTCALLATGLLPAVAGLIRRRRR